MTPVRSQLPARPLDLKFKDLADLSIRELSFSFKESGGGRPGLGDGRFAFFQTIECDSVQ